MNATPLRFATIFAIGAFLGAAAMLAPGFGPSQNAVITGFATAAAVGYPGDTSVPVAAEAMAVLSDIAVAVAPTF